MAYYYGKGRGGFWQSMPKVTKHIIVINLIMFVATLLNENFMVATFGLFYPTSRFFHFWQPLTYMFMHGGFWHIFFNMYTLLIFGMVVERTIGTKKFLLFYLVTGLGAAVTHIAVQYAQVAALTDQIAQGVSAASTSYINFLRTPTVGASGAIYGILIGYAMLYPNSVLTLLFPPISLKAKWFVLIFAGIELVTGVTGTVGGVAHFAHLGGAIFGWLLMLWWKRTGRVYHQDEWI